MAGHLMLSNFLTNHPRGESSVISLALPEGLNILNMHTYRIWKQHGLGAGISQCSPCQRIQHYSSCWIRLTHTCFIHRPTVSQRQEDRDLVQLRRIMDVFLCPVLSHNWPTNRLGTRLWYLPLPGCVGLRRSTVNCILQPCLFDSVVSQRLVYVDANSGQPQANYFVACVATHYLYRHLHGGFGDPNSVKRNQAGTYCHITTGTPAKVTAIVDILAMLGIVCFKGLMTVTLYRNWNAFSHLHIRTNSVSFTMIVRIFVFSFLLMFALVLDVIYYIPHGTKTNASVDIAMGTLPIATALVFGTQRDILSAWIFWKTESRSDHKSIQAKTAHTPMRS